MEAAPRTAVMPVPAMRARVALRLAIASACLVGSSGNFSIKSAYTCESWKPRQPAPNPKPRERRPVAVQAKTAGNTGEGVSSSDSSFDMIAEDWRRGQQSSSSQRQGPHNSQE
mmetsp:Transcript_13495/g.26289  ORF Transcript_13495/g.26289 Transcript_13495/m.26289 type:complete len:113 (-) Transcript_13495:5-343(-)